jgi:hypothetical protein
MLIAQQQQTTYNGKFGRDSVNGARKDTVVPGYGMNRENESANRGQLHIFSKNIIERFSCEMFKYAAAL